MGVLALTYFLPSVLLGPIAGVCADRFSKRDIMVIVNVISAILTLGLILSANIATALGLMLLRSSLASFNAPTQQAYIKTVVAPQHLLQASSYATIIFQLSKVLGPMLGAVVLISFPARACLGINMGSFVLSALILVTLPKDKLLTSINTESSQKAWKKWIQEIKAGGHFIWQHRTIRHVIALVCVWFMCSMMRNSQLAIFLNHLFPHKPNILGYVLGLDGLGAVIAGTLLSRKQDIEQYGRYFVMGFFLVGLGTLGIAVYQLNWPVLFFYISPFVLGLGTGINLVVYGYLLKKESLDHQIGCVYGISTALQNAALGIGASLSGVFVVIFGVREVYLGLALILLLLAMVALFWVRPMVEQR